MYSSKWFDKVQYIFFKISFFSQLQEKSENINNTSRRSHGNDSKYGFHNGNNESVDELPLPPPPNGGSPQRSYNSPPKNNNNNNTNINNNGPSGPTVPPKIERHKKPSRRYDFT